MKRKAPPACKTDTGGYIAEINDDGYVYIIKTLLTDKEAMRLANWLRDNYVD